MSPSQEGLSFQHGGDLESAARWAGCGPQEILDFSNLLNPQGPPPGLASYLRDKIVQAFGHPSSGEDLRRRIAERWALAPEQVLLGAGTTEFIRFLPSARRVRKPLILGPTYGDYATVFQQTGAEPRWVMASEREGWVFPQTEWDQALREGPDLAVFARPNNPLGQDWPKDLLLSSILAHPEIFFLADETCWEVSQTRDHFLSNDLPPNLAVLRSFSKAYAVPGLRLGFLAASRETAVLLRPFQAPWTVSSLALEAGAYLGGQETWLRQGREKNRIEKERIFQRLSKLRHLKIFPSSLLAFTLRGVASGFSSQCLLGSLLRDEKILIRSLSSHPGLGDSYFRVGLRTPLENDRLVSALEQRDRP